MFPKQRVAIYVDGCFWHGCPRHGTTPRHNADWWREKLAANARRDERIRRVLTEKGWTVVRVWAHEDPALAAETIATLIDAALP